MAEVAAQGSGTTGLRVGTTPTAIPTLRQWGTGPGTAGVIADAALVRRLDQALAGVDGHVSVAVKDLGSGRGAVLDGDRELPAASLYKLPVLFSVFEAGLSMGEELPITDEARSYDAGTMELGVGETLSVAEALELFGPVPSIKQKLQTLHDVGLDYIRLGQSATTLSGGEAQRVKLATELSRRATGRTLYILDEPTTGLHFADIRRLLEVLNRLVDQGNTVVIIEHNMDVIKTADWIVDLGPEGGNDGGRLVAAGTPEEVARQASKSYTGQILKKVFK